MQGAASVGRGARGRDSQIAIDGCGRSRTVVQTGGGDRGVAVGGQRTAYVRGCTRDGCIEVADGRQVASVVLETACLNGGIAARQNLARRGVVEQTGDGEIQVGTARCLELAALVGHGARVGGDNAIARDGSAVVDQGSTDVEGRGACACLHDAATVLVAQGAGQQIDLVGRKPAAVLIEHAREIDGQCTVAGDLAIRAVEAAARDGQGAGAGMINLAVCVRDGRCLSVRSWAEAV